MDILDTSLEYLKGIGPNRAQLIKKELNIKSFRDLLYHLPIRYIDRSKFHKIDELTDSKSEVQIKGKIEKIRKVLQVPREAHTRNRNTHLRPHQVCHL